MRFKLEERGTGELEEPIPLFPTELPFREAVRVYSRRFFTLFVLIGVYFLILGIVAGLLTHPFVTLFAVAVVGIVVYRPLATRTFTQSFPVLGAMAKASSRTRYRRIILAEKIKLARSEDVVVHNWDDVKRVV